MNDKATRLLQLARLRQKTRRAGYACIGDAEFGGGGYECDYVSPYTKSAGNIDSPLMVLLQDWASDDVLRGELRLDRAKIGYDSERTTNKRLCGLLHDHFNANLSDVYASNVFPFVKLGAQNASIKTLDLVWAAKTFAIPQIVVVKPLTVIVLGLAAFNAIESAADRSPSANLDAAIGSPFAIGCSAVWCQAHPSPQGWNNRNRGHVDRVSGDWARMVTGHDKALRSERE